MIARPSFLPLVVLNQRPAGLGLTLAVSLIGGLMICACGGEETTGPGQQRQAAVQLTFSVHPTEALVRVPITPPVEVAIQDVLGSLIGDATNAVTLAIGVNPSGGTLSGTTTVNAVGGVASFGDLSIDKAGTGYTLGATSGSLTSAVSAGFDIRVLVTFDAFPDGTPITADTILSGDEFAEKGVLLAGAPESSYCASGTSAAILTPPIFNRLEGRNYLSTSQPDNVNRCNGVPVAITFIKSVLRVDLVFAGANVTYTMKVYDMSGALIGTVNQDAVCCNELFEVSFTSPSANISRVTFGRPVSATLVNEIRYTPGG